MIKNYFFKVNRLMFQAVLLVLVAGPLCFQGPAGRRLEEVEGNKVVAIGRKRIEKCHAGDDPAEQV